MRFANRCVTKPLRKGGTGSTGSPITTRPEENDFKHRPCEIISVENNFHPYLITEADIILNLLIFEISDNMIKAKSN